MRLVASKEELVAQGSHLADLGISVPVSTQEAGPDILALHGHQMDEDEDHQEESVDDFVAHIWRQFSYCSVYH